ncbi:MAG TPA: neutral zinc metallopeptidase [Gemmatimonadales bacterium]|nr:neutral zinc metallopeptidase [Gemmatimonadales bacterium]
MRWTRGGDSSNVEDRRGMGSRFGGGMRLGLGGTVVLLILSVIFKKDFSSMLGGGDPSSAATEPGTPYQETATEKDRREFITFVFNEAQTVWQQTLSQKGEQYRDAKLVLFTDATDSGCGAAQSASGPFYCPEDERVYIDLGFYDELQQRFGAAGDFAQAYVIAHEVGHHVQHLLGIDDQVRTAQQRNPDNANEWSVRLELQADCFAGVWGHAEEQQNRLETGDVEEALNAAAAIGDDRIQRMSGQSVSPESFTHGSSAQRVEWFRRGMQDARIESCNTFEG